MEQNLRGSGNFFTAESDSGIITKDGGYLLAGVSVNNDSDRYAWIVKVDSQGNMMWNQNYGENGSWALCVIQSNDGGYAFAGLTNGKDVGVFKISADGTQEWNETFPGIAIWGSSIEDFGTCLAQSNDGGFVLVGSKNSQILLIKIAPSNSSSNGLFVETVLIVVFFVVVVSVVVAAFLKRRNMQTMKQRGNSLKVLMKL